MASNTSIYTHQKHSFAHTPLSVLLIHDAAAPELVISYQLVIASVTFDAVYVDMT